MLEQKYRERLLQVVRVLRELPKNKKLDMRDWYQCKTTACAIGWAAQDAWFKRRGLHLDQHGMPQIGKGHATDLQEFFGIDEYVFDRLFMPGFYKHGTRSEVIRRIEAFVRKAEKSAA